MHLSDMKAILFCIYVSFSFRGCKGSFNLSKKVSVSALIVFGDSLVDQGNNNYINTLGKANFPPYGKDFLGGVPTGRFSNGKTLADFVAKALGVKEYLPAYLDPFVHPNDLQTGVSFASAGSGYDPLTSQLSSVISLSSQLDMFKQYIGKLQRNIGDEAAKNIITNSVFLVVTGSNDLLLNYFSVPIRRLQYDIPAYNTILVNLAANFVQELHKMGARRIAVFGILPIGCLPEARTIGGGVHRICVDKFNKAAQLFNNMLKKQVQFLASNLSESKVAFVDLYNPFTSIIENPHQYGLQVTDKACCGTGEIEAAYSCNKLSRTCLNESEFFFWDSFHPSEIGYNILVNQILPDFFNILF